MTARRSKPSFASLLRRAGGTPPGIDAAMDEPASGPPPAEDALTPFWVDPARVRPWPRLGAAMTTPDACARIARDGQPVPVTVRPVFDDEHFEYEAIADAATFAAVRRLSETDAGVRLLVRVALLDDDGAAALADADADAPRDDLPAPVHAAFGGRAPGDIAARLAKRLGGPDGPAILAAAHQVARAQAARNEDGLPPYPAAEVMRLLDAVGDPPSAERLSLTITDADAQSVTFRLGAKNALTPEALARVVKAMVDGAATHGFDIGWDDGAEG